MTLDTVRRTFTAWAPFYDATHAWPLPLRREARLALGVQRGDRVLDVACGTGLNFSHLRELVGEMRRSCRFPTLRAAKPFARSR
ncbi:MAG: hypothetical protein HW418_4212 [Anaerolineales bacterium]|nr:hypothetical protein [Anaerolineales bacterium]